ncbi:MAG TPA: DUF4157 domain-containing protein, partial [Fimbriimonadaceae bacterium]|nr:DUF4157 domain-containing protein [Fimbriimonadaceae bacterium]
MQGEESSITLVPGTDDAQPNPVDVDGEDQTTQETEGSFALTDPAVDTAGGRAAAFARDIRDSMSATMTPRALDLGAREKLTPFLGFDPQAARIFTGPEAAATAAELGAEAFTIGSDVFFGADRFDPSSPSGLAVLAHELTHVRQQSGSLVQRKGIGLQEENAWEREAQVVAARVQEHHTPGLTLQRVEHLYVYEEEVADAGDAQLRLERLAYVVMARLETRLDLLGIAARRIVVGELDVELEIDLARMSDDECVEVWLSALVAAIERILRPYEELPQFLPAPAMVQLGRTRQTGGNRKGGGKKDGGKKDEGKKSEDKSGKAKLSKSPKQKRKEKLAGKRKTKVTREESRSGNEFEQALDRLKRQKTPSNKKASKRHSQKLDMLEDLVDLYDNEARESGDGSEEVTKKSSRKRKLSNASTTAKSSGEDDSYVEGSGSEESEVPTDEEQDSPLPRKKSIPKKKSSKKDIENLDEDEGEKAEDKEELFYSSEDDEVAELDEIQRIQRFASALSEGLTAENLEGLPIDEAGEKVKAIVAGVRKHRLEKKGGRFPYDFNETEVTSGSEFLAFVLAMRKQLDYASDEEKRLKQEAKEKAEKEKEEGNKEEGSESSTAHVKKRKRKNSKGDSQPTVRSKKNKRRPRRNTTTDENTNKPTSYNIYYPVWKGAVNNTVAFRGRELYQPTQRNPKDENPKGRSWAAITRSMNQMAVEIGNLMLEAGASVVRGFGHRALALAILYIFAGKGDEVRERLVEAKMPEETLQQLEQYVLEFMALAIGVEGIRSMPFLIFDTFLHLAFIAQGETYGRATKPPGEEGSVDRDDFVYDFENVFAGLRSIQGEV